MRFDQKLLAVLMECGTTEYDSFFNNNCSTFCSYHSLSFAEAVKNLVLLVIYVD